MIFRRLYSAVFAVMVAGFFLWGSSSATAHTLKIDGQTGITLHIEPDDEPVANEPSKLLISIHDKSGAFVRSASSCLCVVEMKNGDETIDSIEFTPDSEGSTILDYTFKKSGQHKVSVRGQPQVGADFEPFDVTFSYRVKGGAGAAVGLSTSGSKQQKPLQRYTPLVVIGALLFVVILFMLPARNAKKSAAKK